MYAVVHTKSKIKLRSSLLLLVFFFSGFTIYILNEDVAYRVNKTLWPQEFLSSSQQSDFARKVGIDDGARIDVLTDQLRYFGEAPLLGTGFFHREGQTSIHQWGSHNFFAQMLLETGLIGFSTLMLFLHHFWKGNTARNSGSEVSTVVKRSTLFAGFLAGLTGEYFYGGPLLFYLIVIGLFPGESTYSRFECLHEMKTPVMTDRWSKQQ